MFLLLAIFLFFHLTYSSYVVYKKSFHTSKSFQIYSVSKSWEALDHSILPLAIKAISFYESNSIGNGDSDESNPSNNKIDLNDIALNLFSWKHSLELGSIPNDVIWPREPLLSKISSLFQSMNLPSLTSRHPELINDVLLGLLEMNIEFEDKCKKHNENNKLKEEENKQEVSSIDQFIASFYESEDIIQDDWIDQDELIPDYTDQFSNYLLQQFQRKWQAPLEALYLLDDMYGSSNHKLMIGSTAASSSMFVSTIGSSYSMNSISNIRGFSPFDGIWKHTGWKQCAEINKKLNDITELKKLINKLGYRADIKGKTKKLFRDSHEKPTAKEGVTRNSLVPIEMTGISRSNSIQGLLAMEYSLLANISNNNNNMHDLNISRRRRLFTAKFATNDLSSYERTGYLNIPSQYQKNNRMKKLPSILGGPIIICLDTSWSMAGPREILAKSVVLQTYLIASKQQRKCFVFAFSGKSRTVECELSMDRKGLEDLLDFLGSSFHGGTDVTSPLKRAIELIENNPIWSTSDIILITDGELQNPPVEMKLLVKIRELEIMKSLEIHALLVGHSESIPLNILCNPTTDINRVHIFLCKYDPISMFQEQNMDPIVSISNDFQSNVINKNSMVSSTRHYMHSLKHSFKNNFSRFKSKNTKLTRLYNSLNSNDNIQEYSGSYDLSNLDSDEVLDMQLKVIIDQVDNNITNLLTTSQHQYQYIDELQYISKDLIVGSKESKDLIRNIQTKLVTGLIERDCEVKLLLLSTLCKEHIVLIGPPGTGKSELSRRLAWLHGGIFFERLLTRYSAPEELFGPLSLRALENDEYIRNIEGYLPTCSVAFLDEIFKANSAILNSLLTVLNERKFDNGKTRLAIPLLVMIGASNELPEDEELDALYDRFLFRKVIQQVSDAGLLDLLVSQQQSKQIIELNASLTTTSSMLSETFRESILDQAYNEVVVPMEVLLLIRDIRKYLRDDVDPSIYVSDRRLTKAINMLKISAITNGRKYVSMIDCLLLKHILWNRYEDIVIVENWLWEHIIPEGGIEGLQFLLSNIFKRITNYYQSSAKDELKKDILFHLNNEFHTLIPILTSKLKSYQILINDFMSTQLMNNNLTSNYSDYQRTISMKSNNNLHLWLDEKDLLKISQNLIPLSIKKCLLVEDMLRTLITFNQLLLSNDINNENDIINNNKYHKDIVDENKLELNKNIWNIYISGRNQQLSRNNNYDKVTNDNNNKDNDVNDDFNKNKELLSKDDLNLSKKEAQRKLSSEDFKIWKKYQKNSKKNNILYEDD